MLLLSLLLTMDDDPLSFIHKPSMPTTTEWRAVSQRCSLFFSLLLCDPSTVPMQARPQRSTGVMIRGAMADSSLANKGLRTAPLTPPASGKSAPSKTARTQCERAAPTAESTESCGGTGPQGWLRQMQQKPNKIAWLVHAQRRRGEDYHQGRPPQGSSEGGTKGGQQDNGRQIVQQGGWCCPIGSCRQQMGPAVFVALEFLSVSTIGTEGQYYVCCLVHYT